MYLLISHQQVLYFLRLSHSSMFYGMVCWTFPNFQLFSYCLISKLTPRWVKPTHRIYFFKISHCRRNWFIKKIFELYSLRAASRVWVQSCRRKYSNLYPVNVLVKLCIKDHSKVKGLFLKRQIGLNEYWCFSVEKKLMTCEVGWLTDRLRGT